MYDWEKGLVAIAARLASRLAIGLSALTLVSCELLTDPESKTEVDAQAARRAAEGSAVYALDVSYHQPNLDPDVASCWVDSGYHHLIVGLQVEAISRQQLRTAIAAGMSVEAYVPLYWNGDMTFTVEWAKRIIADYPVKRLWLDVEHPRGKNTAEQVIQKLQDAVDTCGSVQCGIYTGKLWWELNVGNTHRFSHLPLWYAHYDGEASFADWYEPEGDWEGPFGSWSDPTGKQYHSNDTGPLLCGAEVDYDIVIPPAGQGGDPPDTPPPPTGLSPSDGDTVSTSPVTLSVDPISRVTDYEFRIEYLNDGTWRRYYSYYPNTNLKTFAPQFDETQYRFKVRARNIAGWGNYSELSSFYFGAGGGDDGGGGGGGGEVPPAPTGLTPNGDSFASGSVTLSCDPISDASEYEFEIQYESGGSWLPYYSYSPSTNSQTFWPQFDAQYRWKVRARNAEGWGDWSEWATFSFGDDGGGGGGGGGDVPPAPTGLDPDGDSFSNGSVTLSCDPISDASEYEFEIQYESGGSWLPYYAYSSSTNSQTFWPQLDAGYRWKVRARNANGWGPWSGWATFSFGDGGGGGGDVPPAPTGLDPSGGETVITNSVALSCDPISGATEYEFEIEFRNSSGAWQYYYTYTASTNSKTFWPAYASTWYRWRVRARNAAGWGGWSSWATFRFEPDID